MISKKAAVPNSKVLCDNMTFDTAFISLATNTVYKNKSLNNCLSLLFNAIILWDEIEFPEATSRVLDLIHRNGNGAVVEELLKICRPVSYSGFTGFTTDDKLVDEEGIVRHEKTKKGLLLARAKHYVELSGELGIDYLPHPKRADVIARNHERYEKQNLRNEARRIIEETNERIHERLDYEFDYPLLHRYIKHAASRKTPLDELESALTLRDRKDVKAFRNGLRILDDAFRNDSGTLVAAKRQLDKYRGDVESSLNISADKTGKMTVSGTGSVRFNAVSPPEIGASVGFSKEFVLPSPGKRKVLNMTFLTKLKDYGIGSGRFENVRK
jgi:hypothetical protein